MSFRLWQKHFELIAVNLQNKSYRFHQKLILLDHFRELRSYIRRIRHQEVQKHHLSLKKKNGRG